MKEASHLDNNGTEVRALERFVETPRLPFPNDYEVEGDGEESVRLRDYWALLRGRLWLVAVVTLLITSAAAVYVARKPDVYEAEARIQVDLENNPAIGAAKSGAVIINNPSSDPSYFNTQLLILKSPALLRRVAKTLDVEHDPDFFAPPAAQRRSTWQNLLRMAGLREKDESKKETGDEALRADKIAPAARDNDMAEAKRLEPYVTALQRGLDVDLTETTRLININFSHSNPEFAAKVVNVVADAFVLSSAERRTESNSTASEFLQKRIAELQSQIRSNEERLIAYAKEHQIVSLDAGHDIVSERLATLNRELLEAENQRKAAEAEYRAALAPGAAAAIVEGGGNMQIAAVETKLAELRQRREVMLLEAGENWPEVKELSKQIAELEKQAKDTRAHSVSVVLTNLETRYRQTLTREQDLRTAFEQQHGETMAQNEAAINYRMIQQETATYKGLLDDLLQRSKEYDVILAATPNNLHVIDYATAPLVPSGPRRIRIVALAFAFSLAFGVGLALLLGYLNDSVLVNSVEGVERTLHLPALAVIPSLGGLMRYRLLPSISTARRRRDGKEHPALLLNADTRSPLAESYRKLRTSILLSTTGRAPQTLLMTSSLPGEGKTTAAVNTAFVLAQTGANVLLIDADLRHPSLHEIFEMENQRGLSTVLSNDLSEAEVFALIEQSKDSKLYLMPSGPVPPNPSELLSSERMRHLLSTLGSTFTHIIIDSPPITYFTDGVLLSSIVDGVLLVVHGSKSSRDVARHARQLIEGVGAQVLGVVLNGVNLRSNEYSYYQHYYRQLAEPAEIEAEKYVATDAGR